jgi:hypothetical protein
MEAEEVKEVEEVEEKTGGASVGSATRKGKYFPASGMGCRGKTAGSGKRGCNLWRRAIFQSQRMAATGSMRVARRAGM